MTPGGFLRWGATAVVSFCFLAWMQENFRHLLEAAAALPAAGAHAATAHRT